MRVFLTGANGYLGRVLLERLADMREIESITGIGLTPPPPPRPDKLKFIPMDIRSPELGATMSAQERDDINLNGTRNVAQAALANKIRRFIHASSMAVYDPIQCRGKSDIA